MRSPLKKIHKTDFSSKEAFLKKFKFSLAYLLDIIGIKIFEHFFKLALYF
jgi:hypothetical protein